MEKVQTEDRSFVRDLHSKALLNTDRVALENHRQRKKHQSQASQEWQEMKQKVEELNIMKNELLEIKSLLQQIVTNKEL
jgi:uncharacterized protein YjiS (DUF1127 family)